MVGFGLDYACAHIIIPASVNLLPIQADFVTERDTHEVLMSIILLYTARGRRLGAVLISTEGISLYT